MCNVHGQPQWIRGTVSLELLAKWRNKGGYGMLCNARANDIRQERLDHLECRSGVSDSRQSIGLLPNFALSLVMFF